MKLINTLIKLKSFGLIIISNLVPLLFLLGLATIDVAVFIGFGITIGLIVAGVMLVIISIILALERTAINQQGGE